MSLKIAFLTTDNRDAHRRYDDPNPYFGPAPTALLEGFAMLGGGGKFKIGNIEIGKLGNAGGENLGIQEFRNSENWNEDPVELRTKNQEQRPPPEELRTTNHELETVPPFEIHVISCTQRPLRAPEKIAPNIWYHSLHVPKIGWLRTGYQGCIRAVRRKLREINPDIVHGQGTERDCALNAVLSGYPNVLTIHGNMRAVAKVLNANVGSFYWITGKLEQLALARTRGVFCNSEYTRFMVENIATETWLVPNAVRTAFFAKVPKKDLVKTLILLNIGTISPYKQQLKCLGVMRRLHRNGYRVAVHFAGSLDNESHYGKEFLSEIGKAEAEGYARYLGNLGIKELITEMDNASALIHVPSEEAFGLVVAEGVARNLKFFGTRIGGIPGIIQGVEGAELVDPDDFATLEERIIAWTSVGAPIPDGGQALMINRYHPTVIARRHLQIYQEVISRSKDKHQKIPG